MALGRLLSTDPFLASQRNTCRLQGSHLINCLQISSHKGVTGVFPNMDEEQLYATIAGYVNVVAPVILLYDYIITMADEVSESRSLNSSNRTIHLLLQVRLIWPGPLAFPKLLYYINRYLSVAVSLSCVFTTFLPPSKLEWFMYGINVRNFSPNYKNPRFTGSHQMFVLPVFYRFGFMRVIQVSNWKLWTFICDGEELCHDNDRNR